MGKSFKNINSRTVHMSILLSENIDAMLRELANLVAVDYLVAKKEIAVQILEHFRTSGDRAMFLDQMKKVNKPQKNGPKTINNVRYYPSSRKVRPMAKVEPKNKVGAKNE